MIQNEPNPVDFMDNIQNNKESINTNLTNDKQEPKQNYNLSLSRFIELKSHFDVIRKLAYLPSLNSLVSVSEVE